jgi:hypothetical protein
LEDRLLLSNSPPVALDDAYATRQDEPLVVDGAQAEIEVLFEDFESGVGPGWSSDSTSVTPVSGRTYLGQFENTQAVLNLDGLLRHEEVRIEFDLYLRGSWDGNSTSRGPDVWTLDVDGGPTLLETTFANQDHPQAYPDSYPAGSHPRHTGASEVNTLGDSRPGGDSVYHLSCAFEHDDDSLQFAFGAAGLEGGGNETWGLDNMRVSVLPSQLGVLANDTDIEGDPLTAHLADPPEDGTVTLDTDGTFEYVPDPGFHGIDTFTYRANDGLAESNLATVTITVNDPPVARADGYRVDRDGSLAVAPAEGVLANDWDPNGESLVAQILVDPDNGSITLASDGSFSYVPDQHFAGTDRFTYRASDGTADSNEATVTLEVVVPQGSAAQDDFYQVIVGGTLDVGLVNGTFETGDWGGWTTFATPGGTLGGPGFPDVVTFDANGDGRETESLQLLVGDGGGGIYQNVELASGEVTITAEIASKSVLADDAGGLFELLLDGDVVASHDFGPIGQEEVQRALLSGTAADVTAGEHEVRIRITRAGPSVYGSTPFSFIDNVQVYGNAAGVLANDRAPATDLVRSLLVTPPEHGTLEIRPDGSFHYVPDPGFTGEDRFVYKWVEGAGGLTLYTVDAANDKLVKLDTKTGQFSLVGAIDHEMHGGDLTYQAGLLYALNVEDGNYELVTIDPATGQKISVVPITKPGAELTAMKGITAVEGSLYVVHAQKSAYCGDACGAAHILARLDPETGLINSLVNYRNLSGGFNYNFDALSTDASGRIIGSRYTDSAFQAFHLSFDPPGISYLGTTWPPDPRINDATLAGTNFYILNTSGEYLHRYDAQSGDYSIVLDNISLAPMGNWLSGLAYAPPFETNTATVTIAVGDPPVAGDDPYAVEADSVLSVAEPGVLDNDSDPNGDPLTASLVSGPSHGTLALEPDGSFLYTPDAGFVGLDRFTYKASDALLESDLATVTIEVGPVIVVNSTDYGTGTPAAETTLREAIELANATPGMQTIVFDIPTRDPGYDPVTGAFTIRPGSALPEITDAVVIDGYSQAGAAPNTNPTDQGLNTVLKIELDGSRGNGLEITGGGTTIRGLAIHSCNGAGIYVSDGSGNLIQGNFIGTDVTGTVALPNNSHGVTLCSRLTTIGTNGDGVADEAERNLIVADTWEYGCALFSSSENVIAGNLIGTDATGTRALGNARVGIWIDGDANRVGTNGDGVSDFNERNIICGNELFGVFIAGIVTGNVVAGNFIGTDVTGTVAMPNGYGVVISGGGHGNLIGTDGDGLGDDAERNLISANGNGVILEGVYGRVSENVIAGNYIGTDASGTRPLGNSRCGILLYGESQFNRVGTDGDGVADEAERNVISANTLSGVLIEGAGPDGNVVAGNFIGTDVTGTAALANGDHGVHVAAGPQGNRIGTDGDGVADEAERNLISGNAYHGVYFSGAGTDHNVLAGNYIGTDVTGTQALGNGYGVDWGLGVAIWDGAQCNRVGTDGNELADAAERNVISANSGYGIAIWGEDTNSNVVAGNYVGTDVTGTAALGNGFGVPGGRGIGVYGGAQSNRIGTDGNGVGDANERNVISANAKSGVYIGSSATEHNVVAGNYIGTDAMGENALGNGRHGVYFHDWHGGSQANLIGTDGDGIADEAERNLISGNAQHGVCILGVGTERNVVAGNYIGTDVTGLVALGNGADGIKIKVGARANRVGTDGDGLADEAERNLISGNTLSGVAFEHVGTDDNVVAGNYIGTDAPGNGALGNGTHGVWIWYGPQANRIGTNGDGLADAAERNLIAANGTIGVSIGASGTDNNTVAGNYIGTDVTGRAALPNVSYGVAITAGASTNLIGTDGDGLADAAERNVISGNGDEGVWIAGEGTEYNVVAGNYIGTDATGLGALGNGFGVEWGYGVAIVGGAQHNLIGTDGDEAADEAERNVISANAQAGVVIESAGSDGNVIAGNYIGTDATGTHALGNESDGVKISSYLGSPQHNLIGTDGDGIGDQAERNVISANARAGVYSYGAADSNVVAGNFIGTDATGTVALGNGSHGVRIGDGGHANLIGTDGDGIADEAERNLISGNAYHGVYIVGVGTDDNVLAGNYIGTDVSGTAALGNGFGIEWGDGIRFEGGAQSNLIGTDGDGVADAAERNVISGNHKQGVSIQMADTNYNVVAGNYIGTDANGTAPLGNGFGGVILYEVSGAPSGNRIGTDGDGVADEAERNVISANARNGVTLAGAGVSLNVVAGNSIGTDVTGTVALANAGAGVSLELGAQSNRIGGTEALANTIAFNAETGVAIFGEQTARNPIQGNSIYANGGLGIDLGDDGVTLNDPGDVDTGPNHLQNYPVITAAGFGTVTRVIGTLNSTPNTEFRLDFYANSEADPSGHGEGERWLGWTRVTTDAAGNAQFDAALPSETAFGELVTATATDADGNTSEFSAAAESDTAELWDPYCDVVMADDPFAYYRLREAAGATTAVDETGVHHGSYVNDPTLELPGPILTDPDDTAVGFDRSARQYVEGTTMGDFGSRLVDGFTLEYWARFLDSTTHQMVLGVANPGYTTDLVIDVAYENDPGRFRIYFRDDDWDRCGASFYPEADNVNIYDAAWHHVVHTYDPSAEDLADLIVFYVDSVRQDISVWQSADRPDNSSNFVYPMTLGAWNSRGNVRDFFQGDLDEVAFYTRPLSSQEVGEHYAAAACLHPPVTVNDGYRTHENGVLSVSTADAVLTNDWDLDDEELAAVLVDRPEHGTLALEPDGSFQYAPEASFMGSDRFTYRAFDGRLYSDPGTVTITVEPGPWPEPFPFYFSLEEEADLDGLAVADEDIVAFDGTDFALYFDGSDVGLENWAIDAVAVIGENEILMSFADEGSIPGIADAVDARDVVKFTATRLGADTAGTFEMYFDGSDVGLDGVVEIDSGPDGLTENLDGIELLENGRLVISVSDWFSVPGLSGSDEDLFLFTPTSLGADTAGTWVPYFDGSDVGMARANVDAVALDNGPRVLLSTDEAFSANCLDGHDEDVFAFQPERLGAVTLGTYDPSLYFDGSDYELECSDVVAIDVTRSRPPVADDDAYDAVWNQGLDVPAARGVLANDVDPDGDRLRAVLVDGPAHGTLVLGFDGTFTYVPHAAFTGIDEFTYRASDARLDSNLATVTICVAEPLGPIGFAEISGVDSSAVDLWCRCETTHEGWLTSEAVFDGPVESVQLTLYDRDLVELAVCTPVDGTRRIDWPVGPGEKYYLKVSGTNAEVDLRLANLVRRTGSTVVVFGTDGDDSLLLDAASRRITIKGVEYDLEPEVAAITFDGAGGEDTTYFLGSAAAETVKLWPQAGRVDGDGYVLFTGNVEHPFAYGGGGNDVAVLYDSQSADTFTAWRNSAEMSGPGFILNVHDFPQVLAIASDDGQTDTAVFDGRPGAKDYFRSWSTGDWTEAKMWGAGFFNRAKDFDEVEVNASDASDVAQLYDSPGADVFEGYADRATMSYQGGGVVRAVDGCVLAYASDDGQTDTAYLYDTTADLVTSYASRLRGDAAVAKMSGPGFYNRTCGFDEVIASVAGSDDTARLYDSAGADAFEAYADRGTMRYEDGPTIEAIGFRWLLAHASDDGEVDTAKLHDATADLGTSYATWLVADNHSAKMYDAATFYIQAKNFDNMTAWAVAGDDTARLYDSALDDVYWSRPDHSRMDFAGGTFAEAIGFRYMYGYSRSGSDRATLYDETAGGTSYPTRFGAYATWAKLYHGAFYSRTEGFAELRAALGDDNDLAWVYDDPTRDDHLVVPFSGDADHDPAKAKFSNDRRAIYVGDFLTLTAITAEDDDDADVDDAYVDQVLLDGNWGEP